MPTRNRRSSLKFEPDDFKKRVKGKNIKRQVRSSGTSTTQSTQSTKKPNPAILRSAK